VVKLVDTSRWNNRDASKGTKVRIFSWAQYKALKTAVLGAFSIYNGGEIGRHVPME